MYYNPYPIFVYPTYYPTLAIVNPPAHHQPAKYLAMPINTSPFPAVNTNKLKISTKRVKGIMQQVQLLTDKIDESEQFAHNLMDAAQKSNKSEVERLITSTGITTKFETNYTPDNIRIVFTDSDCCKLSLVLSW
ncbi:hypothetical protein [Lysinibacillus pakistanensis]|uniref:hypothetical protein n=1 Tax=Lysinibacillus pakistanensis TaxID=759811 RepID=UPI003D26B82C